MKNYKFIYESDNKIILGEIKNNRLIQYKDTSDDKLGNIYRARVEKYIESMNSYVLNLGLDKDGLLRKKNTSHEIKLSDEILVEIIKVPADDKMYELSEKLTLSNPYIVLNPYNNNSKNLRDKKYNYFLRSKSKVLNKDEIDDHYYKVEQRFEEILKEKNKLPTPKLIHTRDYIEEFVYAYDGQIITNIKNLDFAIYQKDFNPNFVKEISLDLEKSKRRKVDVNDINIVIDQLEALTVIDVNSVYKYSDLPKEEMSLKVNEIAIKEIAVQLSLRNIKKMVLVDFIRVNNSNKKILIEKFSSKLNELNIKHKIMGFSNMGLLEIIVF